MEPCLVRPRLIPAWEYAANPSPHTWYNLIEKHLWIISHRSFFSMMFCEPRARLLTTEPFSCYLHSWKYMQFLCGFVFWFYWPQALHCKVACMIDATQPCIYLCTQPIDQFLKTSMNWRRWEDAGCCSNSGSMFGIMHASNHLSAPRFGEYTRYIRALWVDLQPQHSKISFLNHQSIFICSVYVCCMSIRSVALEASVRVVKYTRVGCSRCALCLLSNSLNEFHIKHHCFIMATGLSCGEWSLCTISVVPCTWHPTYDQQGHSKSAELKPWDSHSNPTQMLHEFCLIGKKPVALTMGARGICIFINDVLKLKYS